MNFFRFFNYKQYLLIIAIIGVNIDGIVKKYDDVIDLCGYEIINLLTIL